MAEAIITRRGGSSNYFGDGSDGDFNVDLNALTTAPNGGTIANLWDRSTATTFTTSSLGASAGVVAFSIDFGSPEIITNFRLWNTNAGTSRTFAIESSTDNSSWSQRATVSITTTGASRDFTISNITAQYWRLVTTAGTAGVLNIRSITINYDATVDIETNRIWNILFPNTADTAVMIKNYTNLTVPSGYSLTTQNRAKGLIIYVQSDLVVSGNISMTARAAKTTATDPPSILNDLKTTQILNTFGFPLNRIGGAGGAGGDGGSGGGGGTIGGTGGTAGVPQYFGGGYGGGGGGGDANTTADGGNGGNAPTIGNISGTGGASRGLLAVGTLNGANGGLGAGGSGAANYVSGGTGGTATTGKGGDSFGAGGGGSGGAVSYTSAVTTLAGTIGSAAGGVLCIIVGGNITINNGAIISANGSSGGDGSNGITQSGGAGGGGGGGGSGGGVVAIIRKSSNLITNNGTIQATGGFGGTSGSGGNTGGAGKVGTAGTAGFVNIFQV